MRELRRMVAKVADKAGLKGGTEQVYYYGNRNNTFYIGGDVIIKIDEVPVNSIASYYSALESKKPGEVVSVTVRRNRRNEVLKIRLIE